MGTLAKYRSLGIFLWMVFATLLLSGCNNPETTAPCQGGTDCNGVCVNTGADVSNCGACGKACAAGEVCSNGTCALSCQASLTNCSDLCVNTATDLANCGACGKACAAG